MKNLILAFVFSTIITIGSHQAHAILGGFVPANYSKLPLVAFLIDIAAYKLPKLCTGTMISPKLVLTAAHCFKKTDVITKITLIRAIYIYDKNRITQQVNTSQVFVHPDYVDSEQGNDFAIVKLTETLPGIENVTYPALTTATAFDEYIFLGYGRDENAKSGTLKKVFKNKDKFLAVGPDETYFIKFDQTDIKGVSNGDSGGPVITVVGSQAYLIAVNSLATDIPGGLSGSLAGFMTKLDNNIIAWIKSYM